MASEISNKPVKVKPSIYLSANDFPALKNYKEVGENCHLEIDGKIVSVSENAYDGKKTLSLTVEVNDVYTEKEEMYDGKRSKRVSRMVEEIED